MNLIGCVMKERQLTEATISQVLHKFYDRIRRDPELQRPFAVVQDWNEHIARLTDFWSSLMLTTGRYKGNPLSMHLIHSKTIKPEMFGRWLELWRLTTDEILAPSLAGEMQAKAARVASRLSIAMFGMPVVARCSEDNGYTEETPYKVTPTFDENSMPMALLRSHTLKAGSWGIIRVEEGSVKYQGDDRPHATLLIPGRPGFIHPEVAHHLELAGPVKLLIEFYGKPPVNKFNQ